MITPLMCNRRILVLNTKPEKLVLITYLTVTLAYIADVPIGDCKDLTMIKYYIGTLYSYQEPHRFFTFKGLICLLLFEYVLVTMILSKYLKIWLQWSYMDILLYLTGRKSLLDFNICYFAMTNSLILNSAYYYVFLKISHW